MVDSGGMDLGGWWATLTLKESVKRRLRYSRDENIAASMPRKDRAPRATRGCKVECSDALFWAGAYAWGGGGLESEKVFPCSAYESICRP